MASGRVLCDGRFEGSCVALTTCIVVTAAHVVEGAAPDSVRLEFAGRDIAVQEIQQVGTLDIAVLRVREGLVTGEPVGRAAEGDLWWVDSRPADNDPILTGRVNAVGRRILTDRGELEVLQLTVDQNLAEHAGYSGSAVRSGLPGDPGGVTGILVEQLLQRTAGYGVTPPSSNVLYAIPIEQVIRRFRLTGLATSPPRQFRVPKPPVDAIQRASMVADVVRLLVDGLPDKPASDVIIRAPGGMGKTVLSQQVAHSAEVWRAFPGGVFWVQAGQRTRADEILSQLDSLRRLGSAVRPTLVLVDDVWSGSLLADVRAQFPEVVRLLSTSRGVVVDGMASYPLAEMGIDDSIAVLSRSSERSPELDAALRRLVETLGRWPLLLDMASRQLHLADIDLRESPDVSAGSSAIDGAELLARADRLRAEFVRQPTVLDDPESVTRSLRQMVKRSLDALPADDDRRGYDDLAVFPPGARLSGPMLADLWRLDITAAERRIVRLYKVGLVIVRGVPVSVVMHDLHVAELHERRGIPGSQPLQPLHDQCAAVCVAPGGGPAELTSGRAEWLAYHLMRGSDPYSAEVILAGGWRSAYRVATSSDVFYLQGLRKIITELGSRSDNSLRALGMMLRAFLQHALVKSWVVSSPNAALVAYALLGAPEAALREAAEKNDATVLGTILTSLHQYGRLSLEVLDLARQTAEAMTPMWVRGQALTAIASVLKDTDPTRALALAWRAEDYTTAISKEELDREDAKHGIRTFPAYTILGHQRVPIVELIAPHDPDGAARIAVSLVGEPARCAALAHVAAAVASRDAARAEELVTQALSIANTSASAIAAVAVTIADAFPVRAAELARKAVTATCRPGMTRSEDISSSKYYLCQRIAPVFPEIAADLAESMAEESYGPLAVRSVAGPLALRDAGRAIRMVEELSDDDSLRSQAQAAVVHSIGKVNWEQAAEVAARISDPQWAARALIDLSIATAAEDRDRGSHLALRAVALAQDVPKTEDKSFALAYIARTYASADPDLAGTIADLIPSSVSRVSALAHIAVQHALTCPDVASAFLRRFEEEQGISWTEDALYSLIRVAEAIGACDLPGALELIDSALALAEMIPRDYEQSRVRFSAIHALARLAPDRALSTISSTPEVIERCRQFEEFLREVGNSDPRKAARFLGMVPAYFDQQMIGFVEQTLRAVVAVAMAAVDSREACRLLTLMDDQWPRDHIAADVAVAIAGRRPRKALALAEGISSTDVRVLALARIGAVLMPRHRRLAISAVKRVENSIGDVLAYREHDKVRAELACAYADLDLDHALLLAWEIDESYNRDTCIAKIVANLAVRDVARAREIATTMLTGREQTNALAGIAGVLLKKHPLIAEEIATDIDNYELLAEVLRQQRDNSGQASRISELIRQRLISKGVGYARAEGELLGASWPASPCADAPSSVFLRNGLDLKSALDVVGGLLEKWAGGPPVALVNQVTELLLSEAKAGLLRQAARPGALSADAN